jgi:hypothetical protein
VVGPGAPGVSAPVVVSLADGDEMWEGRQAYYVERLTDFEG